MTCERVILPGLFGLAICMSVSRLSPPLRSARVAEDDDAQNLRSDIGSKDAT
jgi:hypothetical protein